MTAVGPKKELDTSGCESLYQVKVKLERHGTPRVVSAEMLTKGEARVTTSSSSQVFSLPKDFERFMGTLEAEGLLTDWSRWIAASAARALSPLPSHISLALNFDPRELKARDFLTTLEEGIPPDARKRVVLELTEQSPIPDSSAGKALISQLVSLGFRLSIDDFCKIPPESSESQAADERAFSHVYYLGTLPVSEVKIDMSCARQITQINGHPVEGLMHWICDLPRHMADLKVVVEGVESDFPDDFLKTYEGNENVLFQGYAYSRNIKLDELVSHRYI